MDPRILPADSLGPAILAALQARQGDAQIQTLLSLLGENLDLLLLSTEGNTAKLQLPGGQVFEAHGELPYPPGTRLTVQVQPPVPDQVAPRLKLVEAIPPPPSPILAPLQQGEAAQLLARLRAAEPAPGMVALARLFSELGASLQALPPVRPEAQARIPSSARILEFLKDLPPAVLQDLQKTLQSQGSPRSLPAVAEAVRVLLQTAEQGRTLPVLLPQDSLAPKPASSPLPEPVAPPGMPAGLAVSPSLGAPRTGPGLGMAPVPAPILPTPPAAPSESTLPPGAGAPSTSRETSARPSTEIPQADLPFQTILSLQSALPAQTAFPGLSAAAVDPALDLLKNFLLQLLKPSGPAENPGPTLADLLARATGESAGKAPESKTGTVTPPSPGPVAVAEGNPKIPSASMKPSDAPKAQESPMPPVPVTADSPKRPALIPHGSDPGLAVRPGVPEPAASPKAWETWMSSGVKALSDPQISPREAPFHLAQAKEGTAFFELPLPWEGPEKVLQMWVEADPGGTGPRGFREQTVRVLVGIHFTALGETRVGIIQSGERLQVRVWVENADLLKDREASIKSDLADLGPGLDFQVLPLGERGAAIPSLRALASGTGFDALG